MAGTGGEFGLPAENRNGNAAAIDLVDDESQIPALPDEIGHQPRGPLTPRTLVVHRAFGEEATRIKVLAMSTQHAVDMAIFELTVHTRRLAATGSTAPGGELPIPHMQRNADLPTRLRHQARDVIPVHDLHALGLLEDSIEQHRFGDDSPHVVPHRQRDAIVLGVDHVGKGPLEIVQGAGMATRAWPNDAPDPSAEIDGPIERQESK